MTEIDAKLTKSFQGLEEYFKKGCAHLEAQSDQKWKEISQETKLVQEKMAKRYEEDLQKINDTVTDAMQPAFHASAQVEAQKKEVEGLRRTLLHIQKDIGGAM